jgi:TATA-box binding protein (TBP) (component of TFIID and TFIIIB)
MAEQLTQSPFKPTPFKISTITATASVNSDISLDALFDKANVDENESNGVMGEGVNGNDYRIIYIEYGSRKTQTFHKGHTKKLGISRRTKENKKRFDNQVTLVYKLNYDGKEICINTKIFRNGNIQMTGLKFIDQGLAIVDNVIELLKRIYQNDNSIVMDVSMLKSKNYKVCLINCDFKIGLDVKREVLHKVVVHSYGVPCSYEPCIYPGCKIMYSWNSMSESKGICQCVGFCNGKGNGCGDGNCKKVTIAVFQSGCIIITGAQSIHQIDDAYKFVCDVIANNIDVIRKVPFVLEPFETKKKVLLPKNKIRTLGVPQD